MVSLNETLFLRVEIDNDPEQYTAGIEILLKLLNNVIQQPQNNKYRTIRLENKIIKAKLLTLTGIRPCLEHIGFEEFSDSGELRLPSNILIAQLKKYCDYLSTRLEVIQASGSNSSHAAITEASTTSAATGAFSKEKKPSVHSTLPVKVPAPSFPINLKSFHERTSFSRVIPYENGFLRQMEYQSDQVMQYEDPVLLDYARQLVPVQLLTTNAIERMRANQRLIRTKESSEGDPCFRDCFLVELTRWFNEDFFRWVNEIPCKRCDPSDTPSATVAGTRGNEVDVSGIRIETLLCFKCGETSRFYRYNDVAQLVRTRIGRCGEYANCFTFFCRAFDYAARLVTATFDHVWCEVYSVAQRRWIHVDPSDNVVDAPLMYQHGWKRRVDYVLAYDRHDVQDVTHRYANDHAELQRTRRTKCDEAELLQTIVLLRRKRQVQLSDAAKRNLTRRALLELADLMTAKVVTTDELKGRSSGGMSWRVARGEQGEVDKLYVFTPSADEINSKEFNLRYSAASNRYERYTRSGATVINDKWESCVHRVLNVHRKVERDWKMVYLARIEDTDRASISWKFDFGNLKVRTASLRFDTKSYESGLIKLLIFNGNDVAVNRIDDVVGTSTFALCVEMSGGVGDVAWQHTQLFRQLENSTDEYPFELKLTFD